MDNYEPCIFKIQIEIKRNIANIKQPILKLTRKEKKRI
jgi:hypothetical protein